MLTVYDEQHAVTYVRMLDAEAEGADWREVSRIVLDIDPEREPDRAGVRQRAKWAAHIGYGNCFVEGGPGAIKIGGSPFKTLAQASDIFFTIASPLVRHAEVVQRDRLTQRARRQRILAIRRGLVDLDVEDEAISLRVGLHTGPSVGSTRAGVEASKSVAEFLGPPAP